MVRNDGDARVALGAEPQVLEAWTERHVSTTFEGTCVPSKYTSHVYQIYIFL